MFISGLLYRAAVVLEGTRFSAMRRTVSLKAAQSWSMGLSVLESAAKASTYSCRSCLLASTSAFFQRGTAFAVRV